MRLHTVAEVDDGFGEWLAFAADGRRWIAATNGVAHLWDLDDLAQTVAVPGYVGGPPAFAPDGSAALVGLVHIDIHSGTTSALTADHSWLTAALDDRTVMADQFATPYVGHVPGADRALVLTRFMPTREIDRRDSYVGPPGQVLLVDTLGASLVGTLAADATRVHAGGLGVGHHLVVVAEGGRTAVWRADDGVPCSAPTDDPDAADGDPFASFLGPAGPEPDAVAAGGPDDLVAIARGDDVEILDADGAQRHRWTAHDGPAGALAFHPHGGFLATGGRDGLVQVWDLSASAPEAVASFTTTSVGGLCWHPDGSRLVVATDVVDRRLTLLDVTDPG